MKKLRTAFCMGLALWICPNLAGADIVKGPYLQDVRTDRITVAVETDAGGSCVVKWGDGLGTISGLVAAGIHHEGVVDGLDPSTCYPYLVDCDGNLSLEGSFCTAALPGEPFSFVVFGDTRSSHADHQLVVDAIEAEGVDFFLNTGDLISDGQTEQDWVPFFEVEASLLRNVPLYPAIGNHDGDGTVVTNYTRLFAPPTDASGSERYYAFTYGNARFIILDDKSSSLFGPASVLPNEQGDWFAAQLDAAESDPAIDHLFVLIHENMYSVKDGRSGDGYLRQWRDVMLAKGVDFVFSGHDHYYCRGEADNGLAFAVSGGGGAGLYDVKAEYETEGAPVAAFVWDLQCPLTCPFTVHYAKELHHYIRIDIHGSNFSACSKDTQGVAFDCFSYGEAPVDGGVDADGGLDGDDGGVEDAGFVDAGADAGADQNPDPCDCTDQPTDPICGEDGNTYENLCELDCAQVGMQHRGECEDPDGGEDGGVDAGLDAGADPGADEAPDAGAADSGPDPCDCPDLDEPVCGVDGKTYKNACLMACMGVAGLHDGRCDSQNDCGCSAGHHSSSALFGLSLMALLLVSRRRRRLS